MNNLEISALSHRKKGFDVLIISTNSQKNGEFWQERLEKSLKHFFKTPPLVAVVIEDWEKGAGNGLGSLYAYQKANIRHHLDQRLDNEESVAIFHTAGEGKRLAPVSLAERSKGAVKLPYLVDDIGAVTMLESSIVQASLYAPFRQGRVSVFWGDQLFIPSDGIKPVDSHVDILAKFIPIPDENVWRENNCQLYGILTRDPIGDTRLLEKIDYPTLKSHAKKYGIDLLKGIGLSLGCFSLSKEILRGLIEEFQPELEKKCGKYDSDPHFWMPATHDQSDYAKNHEQLKHYQRMKKLYKKFTDKKLFSASDIGKEGYWWDFGTVENYFDSLQKLTENSAEGEAIRIFFDAKLDKEQNLILNSNTQGHSIKKSILLNVETKKINAENAILIDVKSPEIHADTSLIYHVESHDPIKSKKREVLVHTPTTPLHSTLDRNGKEDWNTVLEGNSRSYAEIRSSGNPFFSRMKSKGSF